MLNAPSRRMLTLAVCLSMTAWPLVLSLPMDPLAALKQATGAEDLLRESDVALANVDDRFHAFHARVKRKLGATEQFMARNPHRQNHPWYPQLVHDRDQLKELDRRAKAKLQTHQQPQGRRLQRSNSLESTATSAYNDEHLTELRL